MGRITRKVICFYIVLFSEEVIHITSSIFYSHLKPYNKSYPQSYPSYPQVKCKFYLGLSHTFFNNAQL